MPYPSHPQPDPQRPVAPEDPRALARERLAERTRRVRTLRRRAAGGAVAVFLAAWVALFVPAERSASTSTSAAVSTSQSSAQSVDSVDTQQSTDQAWATGGVDAGGMTSGQS